MDKLLHDSLTVHLENFGYENIPKIEHYNEIISSMLGVPKFILDMSDKEFEKFLTEQKDMLKEFEEPVSIKEKEDKEMITAEEARKLAYANNKTLNEILCGIEERVVDNSKKGKFCCSFTFAKGFSEDLFLTDLIEILSNSGYVVYVKNYDRDDNFEFSISWARR